MESLTIRLNLPRDLIGGLDVWRMRCRRSSGRPATGQDDCSVEFRAADRIGADWSGRSAEESVRPVDGPSGRPP